MTKEEMLQKVASLTEAEAKDALTDVLSSIFGGRAMMTSSEILDGICDGLKERGLDDGGEWEWADEDTDEDEESPMESK